MMFSYALLLTALPLAQQSYVGSPAENTLRVGMKAPNFTVEKSGGGEIRLSNYKGKVVMLNFWSTSSPESELALRHIDELSRAANNRGLAVIEISPSREMATFGDRFQAAFGYGTINRTESSSTLPFYIAVELPTTYVIDRNGWVSDVITGYRVGDTRLAAALEKLEIRFKKPLLKLNR